MEAKKKTKKSRRQAKRNTTNKCTDKIEQIVENKNDDSNNEGNNKIEQLVEIKNEKSNNKESGNKIQQKVKHKQDNSTQKKVKNESKQLAKTIKEDNHIKIPQQKGIDFDMTLYKLKVKINMLTHLEEEQRTKLHEMVESIDLISDRKKVSETINSLYNSLKLFDEFRQLVKYFTKLGYPKLVELNDSNILGLKYRNIKDQSITASVIFPDNQDIKTLKEIVIKYQQKRSIEEPDFNILWGLFNRMFRITDALKASPMNKQLKCLFSAFDHSVLPLDSLIEDDDDDLERLLSYEPYIE